MFKLAGVHSFQQDTAALYRGKSEIVPNGKLFEWAASAKGWFDKAAMLARDQDGLFWAPRIALRPARLRVRQGQEREVGKICCRSTNDSGRA